MPLALLPGAERLVLDILPPASIANLRLASKQLQQQIQQSTVSLRLYRNAIPWLLKRRWPSLTRLTFANKVTRNDIAKLAAAKEIALPALTHFGICNSCQHLEIATQELAGNAWGSLTSLSLRDTFLPVDSAKHLQNGNWQRLVSLDLSNCLSRQICGRVTYKKMQQAADTLVASCCYIAAGNWPHLVALGLSHNDIAAAEMAELARGNWPALRKLSLRSNKGLFMEQLASARWTKLQELDLGRLQFSRSDVQQLQNMHWPQLTALDFHKMVCDEETTMNSFQEAWQSVQLQWPLAKLRGARPMFGVTLTLWPSLTWLDVSSWALRPDEVETLLHARGRTLDTLHVCCRVSSKTEAKPSAGSWPCNTFLDLEVLLEEAVLHGLSLGYWPAKAVRIVMRDAERVSPYTVGANLIIVDLLRLNSTLLDSDLTVKGLKLDSMKHLVGGQWCLLEKLDLSFSGLQEDGVKHLVSSRWPLLRELALSHNHLTLNCVKQLVNAQWPCLEHLSLRGNNFQSTKVQCLVEGRWPSLAILDLSHNDLRSEDVKHLVKGKWPVLAQLWVLENEFNKKMDSRHEHCSGFELASHQLCMLAVQQDVLCCLQRRWAQLVVHFKEVIHPSRNATRPNDLRTHMGICVLNLG